MIRSVDFVMPISYDRLLGLLRSANAQVQLVTAMLQELSPPEAGRVESDLLQAIADRDAMAECLEEWKTLARRRRLVNPPAWVLQREDQLLRFGLNPEETKRFEAIETALEDKEGHVTASEIVARGLASLEAELLASLEPKEPEPGPETEPEPRSARGFLDRDWRGLPTNVGF